MFFDTKGSPAARIEIGSLVDQNRIQDRQPPGWLGLQIFRPTTTEFAGLLVAYGGPIFACMQVALNCPPTEQAPVHLVLPAPASRLA
jgi:hypothetical protein